jgi:hypothetical protein
MRNNKRVVICSLIMQSVKENLLAAFRYLLRPLVRLALKNAVGFPEFSEALKHAYVDVAAKQIGASGRDISEEGISLIATIDKQEVGPILQSLNDAKFEVASRDVNPLAAVLNGWHTDPKYTGPYGIVRDLPYSRDETASDSSTFTQLVAEHSPGVSPKELLDELMRTGCVVDVGSGFFRAVRRTYVPDPLSSKSIRLFATVVHNTCEAAEMSLRAESAGGKGLIQRTIYTLHGIPKGTLPAFAQYVRERGQNFADDIDNYLSDLDKEGVEDVVKTGVSFHHYIVNEDDERSFLKELPN